MLGSSPGQAVVSSTVKACFSRTLCHYDERDCFQLGGGPPELCSLHRLSAVLPAALSHRASHPSYRGQVLPGGARLTSHLVRCLLLSFKSAQRCHDVRNPVHVHPHSTTFRWLHRG